MLQIAARQRTSLAMRTLIHFPSNVASSGLAVACPGGAEGLAEPDAGLWRGRLRMSRRFAELAPGEGPPGAAGAEVGVDAWPARGVLEPGCGIAGWGGHGAG